MKPTLLTLLTFASVTAVAEGPDLSGLYLTKLVTASQTYVDYIHITEETEFPDSDLEHSHRQLKGFYIEAHSFHAPMTLDLHCDRLGDLVCGVTGEFAVNTGGDVGSYKIVGAMTLRQNAGKLSSITQHTLRLLSGEQTMGSLELAPMRHRTRGLSGLYLAISNDNVPDPVHQGFTTVFVGEGDPLQQDLRVTLARPHEALLAFSAKAERAMCRFRTGTIAYCEVKASTPLPLSLNYIDAPGGRTFLNGSIQIQASGPRFELIPVE
jgi:hypothetical protein